MSRWGLLVLSLVLATESFAREEKWTHYGIRPLAMGNAFVSVVDDYNALFYNPAGLAWLQEWDGEFLNPSLEISAATVSFINKLRRLTAGSAGDTSAVLDLIEEQSGRVQHFAMGLTPHLVFKNFGFGVGLELAATSIFHRFPTIEIDAGPRLVLPVSYAHSFFEDRLAVGGSIKFRARGGVQHEFSIQDLEAFTSNNDSADSSNTKSLDDYIIGGRGIGVDFGLLFRPMQPMEPTLGISIADFGGTAYEKFDLSGTALGTPRLEYPSVNTGFSFKPWMKNRHYLLLSADAHSINQPYSFSKKFNLGVEWGYAQLIKTQLGLHQGYLTAGFQFDVGLLVVRFATYGEEMGSTAGDLQDRRYIMQLKLVI